VKILKGPKARARRVLLYGQEGVGKSTWAAKAPRPIFLDVEDGIGDLDVEKTERLETYSQVTDSISWLIREPHDYQSLVIDTVDWLEKVIWRQVCANGKVDSIEKYDKGFGKGYVAASDIWSDLLRGLDVLREQRSVNIILLGHCQPVKVDSPETEAYQQFAPDLHKTAASMLREWADEVFFAAFRVFIRKEDAGFSKQRNIAVGKDDRFIQTRHSAGVQAKNRLPSLPPEIELEWSAYQAHWPKTPAGNIAGIVTDGSSKQKEPISG